MAATPEYIKAVGWSDDYDPTESLIGSFETYSAWCWGDVYGYIIQKPTEPDEDGDFEYEDTDESCWGFYGTDHKESGLLEATQSIIDWMVEKDKKEKAERGYWEAREVETIN